VAGLRWTKLLILCGVATTMIVAIACSRLQAGRGIRARDNPSTAFGAAIFSLMGCMILVDTLLACGQA